MSKFITFKEKADTNISLLSVLYITSLLTNLAIGYRYISIGFLIQSGGIFIFPISFIISDILTEVYGSNLAKKLVYYGIIAQFIFALYIYCIIRTPHPAFLQNSNQYYLIFNPYIKFAFASTLSILIGSKVNICVLSKLSTYVGGKYFAIRSFIASTIGELLVTFISMIVANYNRVSLNNLLFMVLCCFTVKTVISFLAIWPAAIVVYKLEKQTGINIGFKNNNIINFLKNLAKVAWSAKSYAYNLESIDLIHNKVNLYYKGTRGLISIPFKEILNNRDIINKCSCIDAANIGYYFSHYQCQQIENKQQNKEPYNIESVSLEKGQVNILTIDRLGRISIQHNKIVTFYYPNEIFNNVSLLNSFNPSQALYIGYLAGIETYDRQKIKNKPKLQLVKTLGH